MTVFDNGLMPSPDMNVDPSSISMNIQIKTHRANVISLKKQTITDGSNV